MSVHFRLHHRIPCKTRYANCRGLGHLRVQAAEPPVFLAQSRIDRTPGASLDLAGFSLPGVLPHISVPGTIQTALEACRQPAIRSKCIFCTHVPL